MGIESSSALLSASSSAASIYLSSNHGKSRPNSPFDILSYDDSVTIKRIWIASKPINLLSDPHTSSPTFIAQKAQASINYCSELANKVKKKLKDKMQSYFPSMNSAEENKDAFSQFSADSLDVQRYKEKHEGHEIRRRRKKMETDGATILGEDAEHYALILELSNGDSVITQFGIDGTSIARKRGGENSFQNIADVIDLCWGQPDFLCRYRYVGNPNTKFNLLYDYLKEIRNNEEKRGVEYYILKYNCQHFVYKVLKKIFGYNPAIRNHYYKTKEFVRTFFPGENYLEIIFEDLKETEEKIANELTKEIEEAGEEVEKEGEEEGKNRPKVVKEEGIETRSISMEANDRMSNYSFTKKKRKRSKDE